jgi:hypothetical protein
VVNEGTIRADVSGGTINVRAQTTRNFGQLEAVGGTLVVSGLAGDVGNASVTGGHLSVSGTYTNNLALPINGGTLTLDGNWFNAGELQLSNAVFNLDGTFGLEDLGLITRTGGTVQVTGLLDGAGGTLSLDNTTGSWVVNGGTLRNLVVATSDSAVLSATSGTLDQVTVNGRLDVLNGQVGVVNGLVLNGLARVGHPSNVSFWGQLAFTGSQVVSGSGEVVFGPTACNALRVQTGGTTLTNRLLIHGHSGTIGQSVNCVSSAANVGVVNEGTISADINGGTITIRAVFTNNGVTNSVNGGRLRLNP